MTSRDLQAPVDSAAPQTAPFAVHTMVSSRPIYSKLRLAQYDALQREHASMMNLVGTVSGELMALTDTASLASC
jgi:hypothetical protein